ncbi:superoxide dismutase [Polycladomyces zharkentensis]|nr:superoxide dismutase [Polycladomyces sp. WAk]
MSVSYDRYWTSSLRHQVLSLSRQGRQKIASIRPSIRDLSLMKQLDRFDQAFQSLEQMATDQHCTADQLYEALHQVHHTHQKLMMVMFHRPSHPASVHGMSDKSSDDELPSSETASETEIQTHPVPPGKHKLPPLPYPYNALEPYIDERTMRLHHDEHHKSYVDGLNKAELMMAQARKTGDFDLIKHWEREAAFNGAGHYLHTLFWETMAPHAGGTPKGPIRKQIERDFGSFHAFKNHFSQAAEKVEGGGWAILVWAPRAQRLEILQAEKHQNLSQWDVIPLLPLDVWEHAYYLKYPNKRKDYIKAWWHVVNWPAVNRRFVRAQTIRWQPY